MAPTPVDETWHEGAQRQPAVLIAVAFVLGIVADRQFGPAWTLWLSAAGAAAMGWLVCFALRRQRASAVFLLVCCAAAGGARHHQFWSVAGPDDLAQFANVEPRLVRLTGTLSEQPWIRRADGVDWRTAIPQVDQSHCIVQAASIETNEGRVAVSGRVRLTVSGHLLHVDAGDEVAVVGRLSVPFAPGNPGQYDFRNHLRRQQCRCVLFANHPDAVARLREGSRHHPARLLARLRNDAERLCVSHLSEANVPLATALLLGDRSRMPDDVRTAFAESGTAHILAISGLHVAILAGLFWAGCRLFNASSWTTAAVIVSGVVLYAVISGGRPPALRATVFILIAVGGYLLKRPAVAINTLALSAIVVLAWNPADLFEVGTQLSFLAVTGIILAQQWRPAGVMPDDALLSPGGRPLRLLGGWLLRGYVMMAGIWLLTLPLTAERFHLASPVGFLINVLLMPLVGLLLASGFAFLLCGTLISPAAGLLGAVFDWQLSGLLAVVRGAAGVHLGHRYVPGPGMAWMAVYYALAACLVLALTRRAPARWPVRALLVWTVGGLAVGLIPQQRDGLQFTVLDMGHGCAVLLELPNGKTVLCDAGTLSDAKRAERTVENAIWARGISQLDAVIISHADVDHFNAVHGLLERIPVGTLLVAQTFLDFEQQAVKELCDVAGRRRIPFRLLQGDDRLRADGEVVLRVLHPPGDQRFDIDNENSLVLLVEYAGRRILLTGDLERAGLQRLLATERVPVDVLLSPHHGSRAANPPELAAWADPAWVVVPARESRVLPHLRETYGGEARVVSTGEHGAVTFTIRPDGTLHASALRKPLSE